VSTEETFYTFEPSDIGLFMEDSDDSRSHVQWIAAKIPLVWMVYYLLVHRSIGLVPLDRLA
jgi:hypothetical protein